jgi:hypothetical protein
MNKANTDLKDAGQLRGVIIYNTGIKLVKKKKKRITNNE